MGDEPLAEAAPSASPPVPRPTLAKFRRVASLARSLLLTAAAAAPTVELCGDGVAPHEEGTKKRTARSRPLHSTRYARSNASSLIRSAR